MVFHRTLQSLSLTLLLSAVDVSSQEKIVFDIAGTKGNDCCIEINAFWDDKPNGDVRVTFSIDDGSSWRAFVPVTDSFIIAPDGSIVGEK